MLYTNSAASLASKQAQIQAIMKFCFLAARSHLDTSLGFFDLLGFDIMIDDDMKVWLIEINVNPALFTNCTELQYVIIR